MRPFRTRIRAVRFKSGGELRLLPPPGVKTHAECMDHLSNAVETYDQLYADELVGYFLVVWDAKRNSTTSTFTSPGDPFSSAELPNWLAARAQQHITDGRAERYVRRCLDMSDDDEAS